MARREADPEGWLPHATVAYDRASVTNSVNWRKLCALAKKTIEDAMERGDSSCSLDVSRFSEVLICRLQYALTQRLYRVSAMYTDGPIHSIGKLDVAFDLASMYRDGKAILDAVTKAKAEGRVCTIVPIKNARLAELEWVAAGLRKEHFSVNVRSTHAPPIGASFSDSDSDDGAGAYSVAVSWAPAHV